MAVSPLPTELTGVWLDLNTASGNASGIPLLIYVDGGACALAVTDGAVPTNLQYSTEAKSGEQVSVSGSSTQTIWARATSGGRAVVRIQQDIPSAARNLPIQADSFSSSGTLSANGDLVELFAPDCASGVLTVQGDFKGTITLTGGSLEAEGGRLLFRSGVGSIGRAFVVFDTDGVKLQEYRFVAGGARVFARASDWVSGTANIVISAKKSTSLVFINGPVHTADEEATRAGRGFIANSGVLPVLSGNVIVATLQNPADSGVNLFIERRSFNNNNKAADDNLEFTGYANPTYVPTNLGAGVNRRAGEVLSDGEFRYEVRTSAGLVMGGTEGVNTILENGAPYDLDFGFTLSPGTGLGIIIEGAGTNITKAVRTSIGFMWYEEDTE